MDKNSGESRSTPPVPRELRSRSALPLPPLSAPVVVILGLEETVLKIVRDMTKRAVLDYYVLEQEHPVVLDTNVATAVQAHVARIAS